MSSKRRPILIYIVVSFALLFLSYKLGQLSRMSSVESPEQPRNGLAHLANASESAIKSVEYKHSVETVSKWQPRVQIFRSLLTAAEGKKIITIAEAKLVQRNPKDELVLDAVLFLEAYKALPVLRNIEKRIAKWTQLPVENGEHFYVQKLMEGSLGVGIHADYFPNETAWGREELQQGFGNRIATVACALQAAEAGGEFAMAENVNGPIVFSLKTGDCVLIYNLLPEGANDPTAAHGIQPIKEGTQYIMTKWIREKDVKAHGWRENIPHELKQQFDQEDSLFESTYVRINKKIFP